MCASWVWIVTETSSLVRMHMWDGKTGERWMVETVAWEAAWRSAGLMKSEDCDSMDGNRSKPSELKNG